MKRRDLERHLRDHGCREIDEGGNHTRWAAASGKRRSALPRHREIDYRLARSICKQLGVRRRKDRGEKPCPETCPHLGKSDPSEPDPTGRTRANPTVKPLQIGHS